MLPTGCIRSLSRLLLAALLVTTSACTFMPPKPWLLPIRTLQLPAGGEMGLRIAPFLLVDIDSLKVLSPPELEVTVDLAADTLTVRSTVRKPGVHLVKLTAGKRTATLAVRVTPQVQVTFTYRTAPGPLRKVAVVGSFTDWQADRLMMQDMDRDGLYSVTTWLPPEQLEYKIVVDGEWMLDPENELSVSNNSGGFNSLLDLRDGVPPPGGHFVRTGHDGTTFIFTYVRPGDAPPVDPDKITIL
ncbi:MAG: glycogen-binding domain-containing protein, partial [Candidatus Marinimicrobia bacterium]|nr:glycogen-binding domain-containing protein [Candidatus Neomarinimicrobiota bacterium]